jgi:hypothetical protein
MRWWLVALCACGKSEKQPTPPPRPPPKVAVIADAAIDAPPPRADEVLVDTFYIDKTETTVAQYVECVTAGACPEVITKLPAETAMGGLDFYAARTYCAWRGKRLPTAAEWMRAAYGSDGRKFPWGNENVTCERAITSECKVETQQAPGRPAGASAFGALDMLGNVEEWVESPDPMPDLSRACVDKPRSSAPKLGGSLLDTQTTVAFDQSKQAEPLWFDNRDQGVRCARSVTPPPTPPLRVEALLAGVTWSVESKRRASDALAAVAEHCAAGEPATMIAGDLVGVKGWAVVTAEGQPGTKQVAVPTGLVRVVGYAQCDFSETTRLIVRTPKKTWKLELSSETPVYQVWLPEDTWATFEIDCDVPKSRGECSFATMLAPPAKRKVPADAKTVEGPVLEGTGGMTCD